MSLAAAGLAAALLAASAPDAGIAGGPASPDAGTTAVERFASRPLGVRTQGTFRSLFLDPTLEDARPAARPTLDLRWSFANDWTTSTRVRRGDAVAQLQADEQQDELRAAIAVPWRGATLGAEWRVAQHWGGWSDTMIETWHRVLHVYNYERLSNPRNAVAIRLGGDPAGGARPAIALRHARFAWGDVVLRAQAPLLRRGDWAVALRGDLKLPTGRLADAGGSEGVDGALSLAGTAPLGARVTVHAMGSATAVSGLPRAAVLQPRTLQLGGDLSLAVRLGTFTVLLEDRVRSALLASGWRYEGTRDERRSSAFMGAFRPHNQVSVGIRRGGLTAWFSEDVTPGGGDPSQGFYYLANQPDFAFGIAWATLL